MKITFELLNESHFPLMLKWLESKHVKQWWDKDIKYRIDSIGEKYESYVKGYKEEEGINKEISSYIIILGQNPIGYVQLYNAHDFARSRDLIALPENLGALDIFIGEEEYLRQNLGCQIIQKFLEIYGTKYSYIFVDPDYYNLAAIKCYEKAGFKIIRSFSEGEIWMIKNCQQDEPSLREIKILNSLAMREPIFHHPEKFGKSKEDILAQICDEFFEVGASGNIYSKKDVIKTLLERYNDTNYEDIWEASDFNLTQIAPDSYLLTYNLIQNKIRATRRSTIWQKVNGIWKVFYHQGTVINGDEI